MNKIAVVGIFLFSLGYSLQNAKAQEQKNFYGIIKPFVDTNNFSGSVMIQQRGKTIFEDSFGRKSIEFDLKNAMDTKFYLASASMIFTSAAIMKLVENGKINLEDKLDKFIPDYQHASKITIHQMLAQRSGIPAIGKFGNTDYTTITQFTQTPQSLYSLFKDYDLLFEPGSEYSHERSEYILLALIIEKITGRPFGEYLNDEIFVPLGMKNTGHSSSEGQIIMNLAKGYATKDLFDLEAPTKSIGHQKQVTPPYILRHKT